MAASATATASGGSCQWKSDDDSWSVRHASKAKALAARYNYSWNMSVDTSKTCISPTPPAPAQSGPKFQTNPTSGYAWPSSKNRCGPGALGSKAWADGSGYSVRDATSHWNRYKVYMTATADTMIGTGGSASSSSTVNDPWHVEFPDTGSTKVHNLLVIQTSLAGSAGRGRGGSPVGSASVGMRGSMGSLSLTLSPSTGKLKTAIRLAPGWTPYIGVRFPKSSKMRAPVAASAKELRQSLLTLLSPGKGAWKSKSPLELTFVKDVGRSAGSADLTMDVFARQSGADEDADD